MRRHPSIIPARHAQGLRAYQEGRSIKDLVEVLNATDEMHKQPNLSDEQHNEIEASGPSIIAGFMDGVIDDIRVIAAGQRGQRA